MPLDHRKGQRNTRDPRAPACSGALLATQTSTRHIRLQLPLNMSAPPPLWRPLSERMLRRSWRGVAVRVDKQWRGQLPSTCLIGV